MTEVMRAMNTGWRIILAGVVGFVVGLIPFLLTYVPVVHDWGPVSMVTLSSTPRNGTMS